MTAQSIKRKFRLTMLCQVDIDAANDQLSRGESDDTVIRRMIHWNDDLRAESEADSAASRHADAQHY